ncbi:MAG TPA: M48 family metallopeptidase [Terracidiphilus sp.]|nr:M48 family metallopeptidase [Terracidiphilus sp.]
MSRDNQIAMGMDAAGQVYQQMPVLPDSSPETRYIRQLGQKLVATIPQQYSWPFQFHVVPQKDINAFAIPGGQMFVNVGTITAATSEGELAGVMAHEMAHVYMQHSAKQAGKAQTTGMLAQLAGMALGMSGAGNMAGGLVGQLGQMGIQMGAQGMMMKYSRNDESQADAVGAVILYKAGYNPQAMADFFKLMAAQGGGAPPAFFSSHPAPGNRQQAIQKEIANWPQQNFAADGPEWAQIHQHAMGVQTYTAEQIAQGAQSGQWAQLNQRNGAGLNPAGEPVFPTAAEAAAAPAVAPVLLEKVAPSHHMIQVDLGPMKMHRPENWQVKLPEKQGDFVLIAPAAGIVSDGVGYGVLLNGVPAQQVQGLGIDEVTSRLAQQMQKTNHLQPVGQVASITVAGHEGRAAMFQSASPFPGEDGKQQMERDWLVTAPDPNGAVIFMIFVTPEAHFNRLKPAYNAMVASIEFKQ